MTRINLKLTYNIKNKNYEKKIICIRLKNKCKEMCNIIKLNLIFKLIFRIANINLDG